jgi:hypothetical protein
MAMIDAFSFKKYQPISSASMEFLDRSERYPHKHSEVGFFPENQKPISKELKTFSPSVHRKFWASASFVTISGVISLLGIISETREASILGAFLLSIGLLLAVSWVRQAIDEKTS